MGDHIAAGLTLLQSQYYGSDIAMPNIKKIDLNLLVVLDALLDERNVTRAAARLGYTQPTISGMLTRLRDLFGDPLFVRTQRGLLPTPRAQALAVPLKQLLADSQRLVARDVFDPASAEVTFTISSNDYMQHALLVPFVKVLRSEAKQIQLAIAPPIIEGLSDALARGQIDLAVTIPEFAMSDLPSRLALPRALCRRRSPSASARAPRGHDGRAFLRLRPRSRVANRRILRRPNRSGACAAQATAQGSLLRAELPARAGDYCRRTILLHSFHLACCARTTSGWSCSSLPSKFRVST